MPDLHALDENVQQLAARIGGDVRAIAMGVSETSDRLEKSVPIIPHMFGQVGTADDTAVMQAALDAAAGGVLLLPPGTYTCGPLIHRSNTTIRGVPGRSIIRPLLTLATTSPLLTNTGAAYADTELHLDGLVFDGRNLGKNDATQTRLVALVRYTKATKVSARNCVFKDYGYMLFSARSCRDVLFERNEVSGAGYAGATANGGSAVWLNQTDADTCRRQRILNCHIHDNEWHGSHVGGVDVIVSGNLYENNKETHVFSTMQRGGNPALVTRDLVVTGNVFKGVRKKDISAHGLELQAWGGVISNNTISDCDHGGIAVERSRNVVVSNNIIRQFGVLGTGPYAGVDVYCTGAGLAATAHISVIGNEISMDAETGLDVSAVRVLTAAGGDPPTNIAITGNVMSGGAWRGGVIAKPAWNVDNCRHWDNRGAGDDRPYNGALTVSAAGMLTISGLPFTPQWIEVTAFVTSAAAAQWSRAVLVQQQGAVNGLTVAVSSGNRRASGLGALQAVGIKDAAGADIANAVLDAFLKDGFRLNFLTLTEPVMVRYTAYP